MSDRTNVLLIGDVADAPWHPLEPAGQELEAILGNEFPLTSTEDYNRFADLERRQYSLCITYTDC